jgi:hypothetical protein
MRSRTALRRDRPGLPRLRVEGRGTRPAHGDAEGADAHDRGDAGRDRVNSGQLDAAVDERADAECRDSVDELVEGDHAACDCRRVSGELGSRTALNGDQLADRPLLDEVLTPFYT